MEIPNRDKLVLFLRNYVFLGAVFIGIYGSINYLTALRSEHYALYFDWETRVPFVPGFVYVYLSILLVFWLPLFFLNNVQIRAISRTFFVATVVAGIVYLILPAELYFVRPSSVPGHEFAFEWLYRLALPHNLFPSLHVTYATLFIGTTIRQESSQAVRIGLVLWWMLLIASIFLVRQHHVADAFAGIALAYLCYHFVYRR